MQKSMCRSKLFHFLDILGLSFKNSSGKQICVSKPTLLKIRCVAQSFDRKTKQSPAKSCKIDGTQGEEVCTITPRSLKSARRSPSPKVMERR